jgi:uncharacterized protein (DUF952 family)
VQVVRVVIKTIYKICSAQEWKTASENKRFDGAAIDVRDGFIHFSTAAQVRQTARLHFSKRQGLVLIAVDTKVLEPDLRWEVSRGGDLFPHLFAALEVDTVKSVTELPVAEDGLHIFPPLEN